MNGESLIESAMPDIFTKEKRSEIMSRVRSKGTKIELAMKRALEEEGIKYDYQPRIFGHPDFLVPPNVVVFCDSAFWHGRNWRKLQGRLKKGYWRDHIERNRKRDRAVNTQLKKEGYIVLRFWNDQIEKHIDTCIVRIKGTVQSQV